MRRYTAALALLALAPMLLVACDSGEEGGSDGLSVNGIWYQDDQPGQRSYLVVRAPTLRAYNFGLTSFPDGDPCWDVVTYTIVQQDDRVWAEAEEEDFLIYRQGDGLFAEWSGSAYFGRGLHSRAGETESEVAAMHPECGD